MISTQLDQRLVTLFAETGVTDVLLNGAGDCWVSRGLTIEPRANPFSSPGELDRLAIELISLGGRQLDAANPFADVVVGEWRVHAVLKSACSASTQLSLRYLGERRRALTELCEIGMFDAGLLSSFRALVESRENFLVCGPTGAGKTTLLRALMGECRDQRIISIEDLPELKLADGCVELLARRPNIEGRGEIALDRLLIEALRMRPDRLVVGELRSSELLVLLQAMNTGHSGSGATLHANSLSDVPARLHAIGLSSGIASNQLDALVLSSLKWVIQLGFAGQGGARKVVGIGRFSLFDGVLKVDEVA